MTHVNGPVGPQGPNYVQQAEVINNNNYYMPVPDSHYQDRVSFTGAGKLYTPQEVAQLTMQSYVCGMRDGMALYGAYNNQAMVAAGYPPQYYGTQEQQLQQLFNDCDMIVNSLYNQPPMQQSSGYDPLAEVRSMSAMVNAAIRDAMTPMPSFTGDQQITDQQNVGQQGVEQQSEINKDKIIMAAHGLHAAMDGWFHTDEEGINNILASLTPEERAELELVYAQLYGNGDPEALRSDLRSELSGDEEKTSLAFLDEGAAFNPLTAAAAMHEALNGPGTEDETVQAIFDNATPEQLKQMEEAYDQLYGDGKAGTMKEDIKDDFGFWDKFGSFGSGAAKGAAVAAGTTWAINAIPFFGQIGYGVSCAVGGLIGGVVGLFSDDSSDKKAEYVTKLDYARRS